MDYVIICIPQTNTTTSLQHDNPNPHLLSPWALFFLFSFCLHLSIVRELQPQLIPSARQNPFCQTLTAVSFK